jgi:hypothetical protein
VQNCLLINFFHFLCVLWTLFICKVAWYPKHIGPSTSLFFANFDCFLIFFVFFKASNINVNSTRKISYCKINVLKYFWDDVENAKNDANISKMHFLGFSMFFFSIFGFFWKFIKNMDKKLGSNKDHEPHINWNLQERLVD